MCAHPAAVTLTLAELHAALDQAWARQQAARGRGAGETSVHARGFDNHWRGVLGEMAFARLLGQAHTPDVVYTGPRPDLGGWEVRYRSGEHYELYVKDSDPDARPLVLLLGHWLPRVCVAGVITAGRARQVGRRDPRLGPHTYVAQDQLTPWRPSFAAYRPSGQRAHSHAPGSAASQ
jgi:hypothetical protein